MLKRLSFAASWVPTARAQSISANSSRRRAVIELAIMTTALVAAATLSLTGS
ncbi:MULTISPECIES: hypothetical protein [unclassified Mycobacterium]|uniref:hypothetical protein n=1 Tax=unclassified Mycobacterium TaxID=2642494 RepID=UPI0029C629F2|nr:MULTISPECIES: hypothetical protein [unclassified Mycobacterium]